MSDFLGYSKFDKFERSMTMLCRRRLWCMGLMFSAGGAMVLSILFIEMSRVAGWIALITALAMAMGSFGWSYYNQKIHNLMARYFAPKPPAERYHLEDMQ